MSSEQLQERVGPQRACAACQLHVDNQGAESETAVFPLTDHYLHHHHHQEDVFRSESRVWFHQSSHEFTSGLI